MGFMFMHGFCVGCQTPISFNPNFVPSVRVDGIREPLCKSCFKAWNIIHRIDKGLEPVTLHPQAYEPQEVL